MLVHIKLSCVGDFLPPTLNEWTQEHHALRHEISQKALDAWQARDSGINSVRFMQKMPSQRGIYFRFLCVAEQDGKLIVSRSLEMQ